MNNLMKQAKTITNNIAVDNKNTDQSILELNRLILNSKIKFNNGKEIYPVWIECYITSDRHIDDNKVQKEFGKVYVLNKNPRKNRVDITFGNDNMAISVLIKAAIGNDGETLDRQSKVEKYINSNRELEFSLDKRINYTGTIINTSLVGISKDNIKTRASFIADYCYIKEISLRDLLKSNY